MKIDDRLHSRGSIKHYTHYGISESWCSGTCTKINIYSRRHIAIFIAINMYVLCDNNKTRTCVLLRENKNGHKYLLDAIVLKVTPASCNELRNIIACAHFMTFKWMGFHISQRHPIKRCKCALVILHARTIFHRRCIFTCRANKLGREIMACYCYHPPFAMIIHGARRHRNAAPCLAVYRASRLSGLWMGSLSVLWSAPIACWTIRSFARSLAVRYFTCTAKKEGFAITILCNSHTYPALV
jgi:hypothetical protein